MSVDACSEGDWEELPLPGLPPEKKDKPTPLKNVDERVQAIFQEQWELFLQNHHLFLPKQEFPEDLESLRKLFPTLPLFSDRLISFPEKTSFSEQVLTAGETAFERRQVGEFLAEKIALSTFLPTLGPLDQDLLIIGVNGLNTPLEKALSHQAYLSELINRETGIDFLYNHSNSLILDLFEIFLLNYQGISPRISRLLQERWQEFDKKHQDNPHKKILIFCHSQAALHVYNALRVSSPEIQNRVIAVTIAPAIVIPKSFCYDSFNYASKKDFIHYGELLKAGLADSREWDLSPFMKMTLDNRSELLLLAPHPSARGIDHEFQSPTFQPLIIKHLEDYLQNHGEYDK